MNDEQYLNHLKLIEEEVKRSKRMDRIEKAKSYGLEDEEADALAELIGGADKEELLYMAIFLAGIKVGQHARRAGKPREKKEE